MADALTVMGITVPVARFGRGADIEVGDRSRTFAGTAREAIRATKATWNGSTTLQDQRTGLALRGLLRGQGHTWSFDADHYSSRSMWPSPGHSSTFWSSYKKFGGYSLRVPVTTSIQWVLGYVREWSIVCWKADANLAAWHHYALTSSGDKWLDGVASPGTDMTWMTVLAGALKFTAPAGANDMAVDDVLCVPYRLPASWPALLYARGAALPALPDLEVGGALVVPSGTVTCRGSVGASEAVQGVWGGAWAQNLAAVEFALEEK